MSRGDGWHRRNFRGVRRPTRTASRRPDRRLVVCLKGVDERPSRRRRLEIELAPQPGRVILVCLNGSRAIAGRAQDLNQPTHSGLVVGHKTNRLAGRLGSPSDVTAGEQVLAARGDGPRGQVPEPVPLGVEPLVELRCAARVQTGQQLARTHCHRFSPGADLARGLECNGIASDERRIKLDVVLPPAQHGGASQRSAQISDRLVEGPARVAAIQLRPEQRANCVPAVEATRPSEREVGEQRNPLRLREESGEPISVAASQTKAPKRRELDHGRGRITVGSSPDHPCRLTYWRHAGVSMMVPTAQPTHVRRYYEGDPPASLRRRLHADGRL